MKILVTGANGFVGRAIIKELLKSNYEIFGTGNKINSDFESEWSKKQYKIFKVDITDAGETIALGEKLKEIKAIVHCAGLAHQFGEVSKEAFCKVNVTGTKNVLQLAEKIKAEHFILISSVAVYGRNNNFDRKNAKWAEESFCRPNGFYAESKLEAERFAVGFCQAKNIRLTILRLSTVIGEEDRGNFRRLIAAIDQRKFIWIGRGENSKSLVYHEDVARACTAVIEGKKIASHEIYNVSAAPLKMKEIVAAIEAGLKKKAPPVHISPRLIRFLSELNARTLRLKKVSKIEETTEKWLADDVYPAEKFEKEYNFKFLFSGREAIAREVEWYKSLKR